MNNFNTEIDGGEYMHCTIWQSSNRHFASSSHLLRTSRPYHVSRWNLAPSPSHCRYLSTKNQVRDVIRSDSQRQTIYALSTPLGKAGIAVIRISGPDARLVWKSMVKTHGNRKNPPIPWKLERCHIIEPNNKSEQLDDGLAVYFKGPRSFTTEDVVELHVHSGRAIIASILNALSQLPFCRPAEPGEFTRRAFSGGRLDLTQVEGLKDLIDAETEGQRRIALMAAGGVMKAKFEGLRSQIIKCLALVEALIDFGEGEEIEDNVYEQARLLAQTLLANIQKHLQDKRRGEIIRSGVRLAIFGPPNAGKSSLLNFLAQREAAIVTSVPGTTRDIVELSLDIGGLPVIVADTAGVRITDDLVEKIGIERAKNVVRAADVSLCVLSLPEVLEQTSEGSKFTFPQYLESLITPNTLVLFNKSDLSTLESARRALRLSDHTAWAVSLQTSDGTADFLSGFASELRNRFNLHEELSTETPLITRERHRTHLESAARFLQAFLDTPATDIVFAAEELRYASQALGKISGLIDVEDILEVVFKDFCIGK